MINIRPDPTERLFAVWGTESPLRHRLFGLNADLAKTDITRNENVNENTQSRSMWQTQQTWILQT